MIVRPAPKEHYLWLVDRTGLNLSLGFRAIEAVDEAGRIHGMVGYDDWTPNSVQMHVAIENPAATRSLLRHAFQYPFKEAGRGLVVGVTPGHLARALKFNKSIGFREVYRIKDGWTPGTDIVIQEMRRDECRWLGR